MLKTKGCALLVMALLLPLAVNAAGHRKAGLWSVTTKVRGGPQGPNWSQPNTSQDCVTAEEAAKDDHPDLGEGDQCKEDPGAGWSGNTFKASETCTAEDGTGHATIMVVTEGDKSYKGAIHMEGNAAALGGKYSIDSTMEGTWIGASCPKAQ